MAPPASTREGIPVKVRGKPHVVALDDIAWIEAQGNYVALHTADGTHLVRDTLSAFHRQLDPGCFVRIHRRVVVAIDRITAVKPVGNGDAVLSLADGNELHVSRSYRDGLKSVWTGRKDVDEGQPTA